MDSPIGAIGEHLRNAGYRILLRRPFRIFTPHIDEALIRKSFRPERLLTYDAAKINEAAENLKTESGPFFYLAREICLRADEALARGLHSVVDKTSLPPSGNAHDYWHPAPYYWPNPNTADGIPYIERDGERVPGTRLYEEDSDKYDRSRLQRLFDDGTLLTLAWKISGRRAYAQHAAKQLTRWFIDPATRMNPHLRYAQIIMTTAKGRWSSAGIIETKDLYYYLDAVRMLRAGRYIDDDSHADFTQWLCDFQTWLLTSKHGGRECAKPNNHGLLYDLQLISISAYINDAPTIAKTLRRTRSRLFQHFRPDGYQPYEMARTLSAHYCTFNLQGWLNLARIGLHCGFDLWDITSQDGRCLGQGLSWLLRYFPDKKWPYKQIAPFDWSRLIPLAATSDRRYNTAYLSGIHADPIATSPCCFHPHDGVPPAWELTSIP